MRAAIAAAVLTTLLATASAGAEQPWRVGERGTLRLPLEACSSYDDWARFEMLRFRQNDPEAAIKFLDQHCPTTLNGQVIVEQVADAPPDIPISSAPCLRPVGNPNGCLWLDSSWLQRK